MLWGWAVAIDNASILVLPEAAGPSPGAQQVWGIHAIQINPIAGFGFGKEFGFFPHCSDLAWIILERFCFSLCSSSFLQDSHHNKLLPESEGTRSTVCASSHPECMMVLVPFQHFSMGFKLQKGTCAWETSSNPEDAFLTTSFYMASWDYQDGVFFSTQCAFFCPHVL